MKMKKRWISLLLVLVLIIGGIAPTHAASTQKVKLNKTKATLYVGKTLQLKVNGTTKKINWLSSNKKVATVSSKGKVKAIKSGSAKITAKIGKKSYICKLTVKTPGLNKKTMTLKKGASGQLKIQGISGKVKWTSSNPKIATVNSKGKVKAVKSGKVKIRAKIGKKTYTCTVTVKKLTPSPTPTATPAPPSPTPTATPEPPSPTQTPDVPNPTPIPLPTEPAPTPAIPSPTPVPEPTLNTTSASLKIGDTLQLSLNGGSQIITWESSDNKVAQVDPTGLVIALTKGSAVIKAITSGYTYSCTVEVIRDFEDRNDYTRGEWIQNLLLHLGVNLNVAMEPHVYQFADTAGSQYGIAIEIANHYGILPIDTHEQDIAYFHPNDIADREFAAVTAVKAMGYEINNTEIPECGDVTDLTYPGEVFVALEQKILFLIDGNFLPDKGLDADEVTQIFSAIDKLDKSITIDENYDSTVAYAPNVVASPVNDVNNYSVGDNGNGTYSVVIGSEGNTGAIEEGSVFILPAKDITQTDTALKAISVTRDDSGNTLIVAETPGDISEVYSKIDYEGIGIADINHAESLSSDVICNYVDDTANYSQLQRASISVPGKFEFDINHKFNDKIKVKGKLAVKIPDITCKVNVNFIPFEVNELLFTLTDKLEFEGGIYVTGADSSVQLEHASGTIEKVSDSFEFGRIPFYLGNSGLSVDLVLSFYYDISGQFTVKYTLQTTQGYQYINGHGRFLFDYQQELTPLDLEGTAKAGLKFGLNLTALKTWDLVGIDFKIGPAAKASLKWRTAIEPNLLCVDGRLYMFSTIGLSTETLVGKFLKNVMHYTLSKELLGDNDENPLRLSVHLENGVLVEECTYGEGSVSGYVCSAGDNQAIRSASLKIYADNQLIKNVYSNSEGYYLIQGLEEGEYTIKVTATGYQQYSSELIVVKKNTNTYVENFLMVPRGDAAPGMIKGSFINAVNGNEKIAGCHYEVRKGWANLTGTLVLEGTADYEYSLTLDPGNYTITAMANGFTNSYINVTVVSDTEALQDISLSPENMDTDGNNIRIILTWGEYPWDLDSHLFASNSQSPDSLLHTYYSSKEYYDNEGIVAGLDWDDTTSYGPETTTIYKMKQGDIFSFYVHDYTNRYLDSSTELSKSGAKVQVLIDDALKMTFSVPMNMEGTIWHVFDYNVSDHLIIPVNTMSYSNVPNTPVNIFGAEMENTLLHTEDREEYIFSIIASCEDKIDLNKNHAQENGFNGDDALDSLFQDSESEEDNTVFQDAGEMTDTITDMENLPEENILEYTLSGSEDK